MSLRRNLKPTQPKPTVIIKPTQPQPQHQPQPKPDTVLTKPDEDDTTQKYLFVSDLKLNDNIRDKFKKLNQNLVEFNYTAFQNKKLNDLEQKNIWLDISNYHGKNYLACNLSSNKKYKIITVSDNLNENWINDIDKYIYKRFKFNQLKNNLLTLTYNDFIENIKNHVDISELPNKLLDLFGVIATKKNKKKILKLLRSFLVNDIPIHLLILACNHIAPCLSAGLEIMKLIKDSHDIKELIVTAIDKKEE